MKWIEEGNPEKDGLYICEVDFGPIIHSDDVRFSNGKWVEYHNPEIDYPHVILKWLDESESQLEKELAELRGENERLKEELRFYKEGFSANNNDSIKVIQENESLQSDLQQAREALEAAVKDWRIGNAAIRCPSFEAAKAILNQSNKPA